MPPTWYAQVANMVAMLGLGVAGLAVAARRGLPERHRVGWRLAGQLFTLGAVSGLFQNAWGGAALLAGPGTPTWDAYLRWSPGINYGRCLAFFAFGGLLIAHSLRQGGAAPLRSRAVWLILLAAFLAGLPAGLWEGPQGLAHMGNYAVLNTALVVTLLCALAVAVAADTVDRLLALALTVDNSAYPLASLWMAWKAQEAPGVQVPSALTMQVHMALFTTAALGIALYRWRLARRGVDVPGLLPALFRRAGVA